MTRNTFLIVSFLLLAGMVALSLKWPWMWWSFVLVGPVLAAGFHDLIQTKHAIRRNFPLMGRGRYWMEWLRPKLYQYFVESDIDGRPVSRIRRSVAYQRAKNVRDTVPFGTELDVYEVGYEWINHSIGAQDPHELDHDPRIVVGAVGNPARYDCSLLNVSAMSFGSLSKAAIEALNGGAAQGGFAHNTGEGGISPYHSDPGGDLIYQIGTGYFGSRAADGGFSDKEFSKRAAMPQVKMIEVKLSQGAKPGHGGILPGKKNTKEIAGIRGVKPGVDVLSPPYHKAFSTPRGLLEFVHHIRTLAGGKPVGFKLCIGRRSEFIGICKAMVETGIRPDFIAVDGGEGGTGAAPLEFSNSVGMPYRDGLAFAIDALTGFDLKQQIKVIAAGKIITGFDVFRALCLGADATYSARAMMFALGCIQALECNKNTCPTGVATQDPELVQGLVVADKATRVYHYHRETMEAFVELLAATGLENHEHLERKHVFRRTTPTLIQRYDEIYPYMDQGCLLRPDTIPESWRGLVAEAKADTWN